MGVQYRRAFGLGLGLRGYRVMGRLDVVRIMLQDSIYRPSETRIMRLLGMFQYKYVRTGRNYYEKIFKLLCFV